MLKKISFTFDGIKYFGLEKDTLASALLRNGVFLVGRSFKYHRPRGIISAGREEPNAIVQLESGEITEPNVRATEIELYEGLSATSQNNWPSVKFDFGSINDFLSPFFPAGFYYKTFMWPRKFWKKYEYFIRRAAGLGKSPTTNDPDQYEHFHYHCDIIVVGSGISGLFATLLAASANLKVLLVEQEPVMGGENNFLRDSDQKSTNTKIILKEIQKYKNVKIIENTSVFAYMHFNYLLACQKINFSDTKQIIWKIRAKKVVLATGSIERFLTFNNNDRPGIMLANSARKYLNFYNVNLGKKIIIFTNNDQAYQTAIDHKLANIDVACIIDVRKNSKGALIKEAEKLGIKILFQHVIIDTFGRNKINAVHISKIDIECKKLIGKAKKLSCDLLCVSVGWNPTVHLFSQSRGQLIYRESDATFIPNKSFQDQISIGACNGTLEYNEIIDETFNEVSKLLANIGKKNNNYTTQFIKTENLFYDKIKHIWIVPSNKNFGQTKMFVDFQNDVTAKDIKIALKEGYVSIEHVKRYTTTGMATDQGKISNVNALGIISKILKKPIYELGTTSFRLPYTCKIWRISWKTC